MAAGALGPQDGLPANSGLSQQLWLATQHEVYQSLHNPFVQGLAQGTLPRASFQAYVSQDAYFLQHFAKAYGVALAKAADLDPDAYEQLAHLLRGVHSELSLHNGYAEKWGVSLADCCPSPATLAYTDFLMEVAEQGSVVEILAAMTPCARLYGFLGCTLARAYPDAQHEYAEWIATYSSPEYLACPALKESLLDRLAEQCNNKAALLRHYRKAMVLEAAFFSTQPHMPPYRAIGTLVVDFDETCTARDTTGTLMGLSAQAADKGRATPGDASACRELVHRLGGDYVAAQQELLQGLLPPPPHKPVAAPGAPAQAAEGSAAGTAAFNPEGLASFLDQLSDFDERMNAVAEASSVLQGSTELEVAAAGSSVQLRPHCRDTLRTALARGAAVHVVSVNWSDGFVAAALGLPTTFADRTAEQPAPAAEPLVPSITVQCNRLEVGADGLTTGRIAKHLQSARDKLKAFQWISERPAPTTALDVRHPVVFVGDSTSDLAALLKADYGVVVGANSLLRRVAAAYGVQLLPLAAAPLDPAACSPGVLYEATGWEEVRAFLFGPEGAAAGQPAAATAASASSPAPADAVAPAASANGSSASEVGKSNGHHAAGPQPEPSQQRQREQCTVPDQSAAAPAAVGRIEGTVAVAPAAGLPRVLTIAGSDSGGGAGIQADLKAIMARGAFGMSALTALTAQNTHGVHAVHSVPLTFLEQQLDAVLNDLGADAIKTGMLPNAEAVQLVARKVADYVAGAGAAAAAAAAPTAAAAEGGGCGAPGPLGGEPPAAARQRRGVSLVVDPVLVSTSGHALAEDGVAAALLRHLLPLATLVTPNIPEASALLGGIDITTVEHMENAARQLQQRTGCGAVLVKGGHLHQLAQQAAAAANSSGNANGSGSSTSNSAVAGMVDVLYDGQKLHHLTGPAFNTLNTHGTGCTLASSTAAELAKGLPLLEAVATARRALQEALGGSISLSLGTGVQRPFNHALMVDPPPRREGAAGGAAEAGGGGGSERYDRQLLRRQLRLYAVTDPQCNERCGRSLVEAVQGAIAGGATIVQVRAKNDDGGPFLEEVKAVLQVCRAAGVPLIVNDRVDVAMAAGADGVHVGQSDLPAAAVRALMGPAAIVGVSVKTAAQAHAAAADGADYLGCGAVYATGTKDSDVIGVEGLAAACAASDLPVVAIGGVGAANAADMVAAGAAGIAVVSAVFAAPDVAAAAAALRQVVDGALVSFSSS